eukprot:SAG31_NODE_35718_length_320_cov_1.135747_1_plen_80_part_10
MTLAVGIETIVVSVTDILNEDPPRSMEEGWVVGYICYGIYKVCEQVLYMLMGYCTYCFAKALLTPPPEISVIGSIPGATF